MDIADGGLGLCPGRLLGLLRRLSGSNPRRCALSYLNLGQGYRIAASAKWRPSEEVPVLASPWVRFPRLALPDGGALSGPCLVSMALANVKFLPCLGCRVGEVAAARIGLEDWWTSRMGA